MPRRGEKREIILDAAEEIFGEKGFHLTTVDEIASKANVAKGTIYLYFRDKFDLFISTVERRLNGFVSKLEEAVEGTDDPMEAITRMIEIHFEFAKSNEQLFRHMTPEKYKPLPDRFRQIHVPTLRERIFKPINRVISVIERCIREGQEKGVFKAEIDPRISALSLSSMIRGVVFARMIDPELAFPNDESLETIKTISLNGIRR